MEAGNSSDIHVLIVGGGFGGITVARELGKRRLSGVSVELVSDSVHFEFRPGLYQVVTGNPARKACVPMAKILAGLPVSFTESRITEIDTDNRAVYDESGRRFKYDYLVLALGSTTTYFGIPGIEAHSFGLRTIKQAMDLHQHLHSVFKKASELGRDRREEQIALLHFVVVGGGPAGVELAGELAMATKKLTRRYKISPYRVTIDLIEAKDRILPSMRKNTSQRVLKRLHSLGINIFTGRSVTGERKDELDLHGMTIETATVVWAAGIKPNALYESVPAFSHNENGRVEVHTDLRAPDLPHVFVIGDGAATNYSGLAQTAIAHGETAADNIAALLEERTTEPHIPRQPIYALPVGRGWAAVEFSRFTLFGFWGWLVRKAADFRFFLSILPVTEAVRVLTRSHEEVCGECGACAGLAEQHEGWG